MLFRSEPEPEQEPEPEVKESKEDKRKRKEERIARRARREERQKKELLLMAENDIEEIIGDEENLKILDKQFDKIINDLFN